MTSIVQLSQKLDYNSTFSRVTNKLIIVVREWNDPFDWRNALVNDELEAIFSDTKLFKDRPRSFSRRTTDLLIVGKKPVNVSREL